MGKRTKVLLVILAGFFFLTIYISKSLHPTETTETKAVPIASLPYQGKDTDAHLYREFEQCMNNAKGYQDDRNKQEELTARCIVYLHRNSRDKKQEQYVFSRYYRLD